MAATVDESFINRPEYLLALMFSAPDEQTKAFPSVTIDFMDSEVRATVQRPCEDSRRAPRLLATKDTIFAAILLHHLVMERGGDFAESLVERARRFSRRAVYRRSEYQPRVELGHYPPEQSPDADTSAFFQQLEIGPGDLEVADAQTRDSLAFLEREGLVIDPAFTPELMVLAGLVPMHFSVRTPKGQKVYREIRVNAPMWSLDITRGNKNDRPFTDVEFRFRGIEIVRKAIIAMATQYLDSEEELRRSKGQPVLRRRGAPELDTD
jgi:hypothetical protein